MKSSLQSQNLTNDMQDTQKNTFRQYELFKKALEINQESVRNESTVEEYDELIKLWGIIYREDKNDQDFFNDIDADYATLVNVKAEVEKIDRSKINPDDEMRLRIIDNFSRLLERIIKNYAKFAENKAQLGSGLNTTPISKTTYNKNADKRNLYKTWYVEKNESLESENGNYMSPAGKSIQPPQPSIKSLFNSSNEANSKLISNELVIDDLSTNHLIEKLENRNRRSYSLPLNTKKSHVTISARTLGKNLANGVFRVFDSVYQKFKLYPKNYSSLQDISLLDNTTSTFVYDKLGFKGENKSLNKNAEEDLLLNKESWEEGNSSIGTIISSTPKTLRKDRNNSFSFEEYGEIASCDTSNIISFNTLNVNNQNNNLSKFEKQDDILYTNPVNLIQEDKTNDINLNKILFKNIAENISTDSLPVLPSSCNKSPSTNSLSKKTPNIYGNYQYFLENAQGKNIEYRKYLRKNVDIKIEKEQESELTKSQIYELRNLDIKTWIKGFEDYYRDDGEGESGRISLFKKLLSPNVKLNDVFQSSRLQKIASHPLAENDNTLHLLKTSALLSLGGFIIKDINKTVDTFDYSRFEQFKNLNNASNVRAFTVSKFSELLSKEELESFLKYSSNGAKSNKDFNIISYKPEYLESTKNKIIKKITSPIPFDLIDEIKFNEDNISRINQANQNTSQNSEDKSQRSVLKSLKKNLFHNPPSAIR